MINDEDIGEEKMQVVMRNGKLGSKAPGAGGRRGAGPPSQTTQNTINQSSSKIVN